LNATPQVIALLHPGEMGAAVGRVLVESGHEVLWCSAGRGEQTARRAIDAGLTDTASLETMLERADVVFSICPPHAAIDVAESVAESLAGFAGLYLDANAISPASAAQVEQIITSAGGRYVDGGIVGPPPGGTVHTRLYLSGKEAAFVAALFAGEQVETTIIGDRPGAASALKLAYSAWSKGTAALLLAIRAFARAEGVEADLLKEWSSSRPQLLDESIRAAHSAATKGWRWVGEMEEIAASFKAVGLPGGTYEAAAEIYARSDRDESARPDAEIFEHVMELLKSSSTQR
jgi:3-hydroxyisobutyrate dehydrogenase-like beta-hydroxyacid dehydrogenase